jgi:DNA repair exonuclease SbcCD ATPase subunit
MDEYYSNRIDAINKEKEARLDAIDEQIKKLDELTQKEDRQKQEQQDQAEIESLRDRIARAQDPLEKFSLQQELDQKLKERDERLKQEKREDEKERLQELKDDISDQYDARIEGLRNQQEAERKFMEQRKQMVEQSYKQMLSSLDQFASDNLTTLKQNQDDIISMFNDNASKYYDSAQNLGEMFAQGLESQVERVKEAAAQLAQAAADVLELHSPAKEGPLSKLGTWWKAFVPTLMQGMDMNMLKNSVINTIQLSKYVVPAVSGITSSGSSSNSEIYVEHLEILADDVLQYANVVDGLKFAIRKGIRRR